MSLFIVQHKSIEFHFLAKVANCLRFKGPQVQESPSDIFEELLECTMNWKLRF